MDTVGTATALAASEQLENPTVNRSTVPGIGKSYRYSDRNVLSMPTDSADCLDAYFAYYVSVDCI